ncbi:hypothetical protein CYMTET_26780 [Cymbomonas tetramitiformis]|uniref:Uncharacterized protein n=1 Tax=Cymbomonas tetramitiformis TaxID=36881 RepID=A0AAE0FRS4_9CHLO|nr:hypothetical protein CYMTET_26780 [Cymbomonas tetramitiformis]
MPKSIITCRIPASVHFNDDDADDDDRGARAGAGGTEAKTEKLEETEEPEETEETEETEEPENTALANACNSFGWDETATPKTKQFLSDTGGYVFGELWNKLQKLENDSGSDGRKQQIWRAAAITMENASKFVDLIKTHIDNEKAEKEKREVAASVASLDDDATASEELKKLKEQLKTLLTNLPSEISSAEDLHELKTSLSNILEEDIPPIADFESGVKRVKATHPPTANPTVDDEANDGENATSGITSVVESESESDTADDQHRCRWRRRRTILSFAGRRCSDPR